MKKIFFEFINNISEPIFLLSREGNLEFANDSAKYAFNLEGGNNLRDYINIDKLLSKVNSKQGENECFCEVEQIQVMNNTIYTYIKNISNISEYGYFLYLSGTISTSPIIKSTINAIDTMISIHNDKGDLLNYNESMENMIYENIGVDISTYIGKNIKTLTEEGLAKDTITDKVLKVKRKVTKNVIYANGKTITYSGIPIFNKHNVLEFVVLTGRDVSGLVELKKSLLESKQKNEEYLKKINELKYERSDVIYTSKEMENIIKIAKRVAPTDSSVFIRGSSGVGKEVIAKFIYKNSNRKDKDFIAVNCAAIPSELLEMEFFGYEEGSFTGAKKGGKKGLLEIANEGTIFLDEIGELPMGMQSKFLRVIQEGGFTRIGGSEFIKTDIRYISATNITPDELLDGTKFRSDLYYRISVVPLNIPDIKDRKEDIVPLTSYFINKFNEKYNRKVKVTEKALKVFMKHDWPGNVREIKNIMERLIILVEDDFISEEDFNSAINLDFKKKKVKSMIVDGNMTLSQAHELLDEILIEKAIKEHGSILEAAKVLEVDPSTIHRKLKKINK